MKVLNFRVPDELHERLQAAAAAEGVSLSQYARARLEGTPDAAEGVWVAGYSDGSGATIHANEVDALHEGVRHSKDRVARIPYGDDIVTHLRG